MVNKDLQRTFCHVIGLAKLNVVIQQDIFIDRLTYLRRVSVTPDYSFACSYYSSTKLLSQSVRIVFPQRGHFLKAYYQCLLF